MALERVLPIIMLPLAAASFHVGESDADVALRVGQANIASFQRQTQLMIDAWQEACKIDKACSTADQSILAKVYGHYTSPMRCFGNAAFLRIAPDDVPHMTTEGIDASRAGYNLTSAEAKECFAHDTTVMAAGDVAFGIQNVEEEFSIVPGTGGRTILVAASFDMGWDGEVIRARSIYRYDFTADGLIATWEATYDAVFVYAALRDRAADCLRTEGSTPRARFGGASTFASGALAGALCVALAERVKKALRQRAAATDVPARAGSESSEMI